MFICVAGFTFCFIFKRIGLARKYIKWPQIAHSIKAFRSLINANRHRVFVFFLFWLLHSSQLQLNHVPDFSIDKKLCIVLRFSRKATAWCVPWFNFFFYKIIRDFIKRKRKLMLHFLKRVTWNCVLLCRKGLFFRIVLFGTFLLKIVPKRANTYPSLG